MGFLFWKGYVGVETTKPGGGGVSGRGGGRRQEAEQALTVGYPTASCHRAFLAELAHARAQGFLVLHFRGLGLRL